MKEIWKRRFRTALCILVGAGIGLLYYALVGCPSGGCVIASNPFISMGYMALVGWLLAGATGKECKECHT